MPKRPRSRSRTSSPVHGRATQCPSRLEPQHEVDSSSTVVRPGKSREGAVAPNTPHVSDRPTGHRRIADLFPFQEIFLRILSFLDLGELALIQRVSKYWERMSVDPQLWKKLYLARYPHPHHSRLIYSHSPESERRSSAPRTPRSLRPIARLPSRAFPPPSPSPRRSPSISDGTATPSYSQAHTPGGFPTPSGSNLGRKGGSGHATPLSRRSAQDAVAGGAGGEASGNDAGANAPVSQEGEEIGSGVRNDGVDWKSMLRLGTNWSNGNALSQTTISLPPSPSPSVASLSIPNAALDSPTPAQTPVMHAHSQPGQTEQHLALSPSYIFVSSPTSPLVQVHSSSSPSTSRNVSNVPLGIIPPPPGWSSPHRPDNVTCIVSDQAVVSLSTDNERHLTHPWTLNPGQDATSSPRDKSQHVLLPTRLVVFYQSGGFVLLSISPQPGTGSSHGGISWTRESIHPPHTRPRSVRRRATYHTPLEGDPVVLAALHYPVLLSCTSDFHLSVYSFDNPLRVAPGHPVMTNSTVPGSQTGVSGSRPRHLKTMHSEVSFHPATLSLFPSPTEKDHGDASQVIESDSEHLAEHNHFKAALTYCTPIYPSSWTVAVQEIAINLPLTSTSLDSNTHSTIFSSNTTGWEDQASGLVSRGECFTLATGSRGDGGDTSENEEFTWPRKVRPLVGVRGRATGIGSDGRWCVIAGQGNQIQVYSLPHRQIEHDHDGANNDSIAINLAETPQSGSKSGGSFKLVNNVYSKPLPRAKLRSQAKRHDQEPEGHIKYSQTLLAHSTEITSLALASGRCVSGGRDGRVLVWELDEDEDEDEDGEVGDAQADVQGRAHGPAGGVSSRIGRVGRTVGYVEVRSGGRRPGRSREIWRGAAGPQSRSQSPSANDGSDSDSGGRDSHQVENGNSGHFPLSKRPRLGSDLPHPQSISSAARSLFLPTPPGIPSISDPNNTKHEHGATNRTGEPSEYPITEREARGGRGGDQPATIRYLAFDEEKIVGLIRSSYIPPPAAIPRSSTLTPISASSTQVRSSDIPSSSSVAAAPSISKSAFGPNGMSASRAQAVVEVEEMRIWSFSG